MSLLMGPRYLIGTLVWAKMPGYPWWPAIVDVCPDVESHWFASDEKEPDVATHYHVVFLDDVVSRSWLTKKNIQAFPSDGKAPRMPQRQGGLVRKFVKQINKARAKALDALSMSEEEAIAKYGFVQRYKGKIGPSKPPLTQSSSHCDVNSGAASKDATVDEDWNSDTTESCSMSGKEESQESTDTVLSSAGHAKSIKEELIENPEETCQIDEVSDNDNEIAASNIKKEYIESSADGATHSKAISPKYSPCYFLHSGYAPKKTENGYVSPNHDELKEHVMDKPSGRIEGCATNASRGTKVNNVKNIGSTTVMLKERKSGKSKAMKKSDKSKKIKDIKETSMAKNSNVPKISTVDKIRGDKSLYLDPCNIVTMFTEVIVKKHDKPFTGKKTAKQGTDIEKSEGDSNGDIIEQVQNYAGVQESSRVAGTEQKRLDVDAANEIRVGKPVNAKNKRKHDDKKNNEKEIARKPEENNVTVRNTNIGNAKKPKVQNSVKTQVKQSEVKTENHAKKIKSKRDEISDRSCVSGAKDVIISKKSPGKSIGNKIKNKPTFSTKKKRLGFAAPAMLPKKQFKDEGPNLKSAELPAGAVTSSKQVKSEAEKSSANENLGSASTTQAVEILPTEKSGQSPKKDYPAGAVTSSKQVKSEADKSSANDNLGSASTTQAVEILPTEKSGQSPKKDGTIKDTDKTTTMKADLLNSNNNNSTVASKGSNSTDNYDAKIHEKQLPDDLCDSEGEMDMDFDSWSSEGETETTNADPSRKDVSDGSSLFEAEMEEKLGMEESIVAVEQ